MPIYLQKCENGHEFDAFLKLKDYKTNPDCECGAKSKRIIVPPMVNFDMQPWDSYESPATGKVITSYAERKKDMESSGCVDYDPGVRTENHKRALAADKKIEDSVDETVEKTFDAMPSAKKETLENELKYMDCEYTRT